MKHVFSVVLFFIIQLILATEASSQPANQSTAGHDTVHSAVKNKHDNIDCDPMVEVVADTTLVKLLTRLANQFQFSLSISRNLDKPVLQENSMPLDQLIQLVSADMSTVLRHEASEGCSRPRLVELIVMPVGEEGEIVNVVQSTPVQAIRQQQLEPIHIENMERYVIEVLRRERRPEVKRMTQEQRAEFKTLRKRLRKVHMPDNVRNKHKNKSSRK